MQQRHVSIGPSDAVTELAHDNTHAWLTRLCGVPCGRESGDAGPARTRGPALVHVDGRRCESADLTVESVDGTAHTAALHWRVGDGSLRLTTVWCACPETGVVSRRDTLANTGETPVTVSRCLARIAFLPGCYECYTQTSRWCGENQGAWQSLHAGLTLHHASGRTTEGSTPYLALRPVAADGGIGFHLLPCGNWTIHVTPVTAGGELPYAVVELGLADDNLHHTLRPGALLALPEILFQPLPQGQPHLAAPVLHRYLLAHHFATAKPEALVVYNTWFDQFEILDVPRLRGQLAAAAEVGCEVLVIDAGWYGAGGPDWAAQTGDWREKTATAFHGKMREFAAEVRAAGLGFGLWMEPERFGPEAPIRAEHSAWFIPVGSMARIDLTQPAAGRWLRAEIGRLVETYQLAWMKIDFNFTLDTDASGAELHDYFAAWYGILDDIRAAYPDTFFEGCSSGAMRADLATVSHVDGHFLSDSVNPVDMLRIAQGALLRLPPGRLARWAVLRSAGQVVPRYRQTVADSPPTILVPGGASWEPAESMDLDVVLLAALPGMMGFSGDLAGLAPEHRARLVQVIAFYKEWRGFITGAVAHLLTPPQSMACREGWIGVQLQAPGADTSLVFVYRLGNAGAPPPLRPRALAADTRYAVRRGFGLAATSTECTGAELMRDGLQVHGTGPLAMPGSQADMFGIRGM